MNLNVAHIEKYSFIYGPGCRYVIWTQGCSIRCKGCWNTSMWDFVPKNVISLDELLEQILMEKSFIEGVTFLGGEPFDQFESVLNLCKELQKNQLSIMIFTGYELQEIHQKSFNEILNYIDILITGRYDFTKRTLNHQWIGSTNQQIHFLSDRYKNYSVENQNFVEITIDENTQLNIIGFPEKSFIASF